MGDQLDTDTEGGPNSQQDVAGILVDINRKLARCLGSLDSIRPSLIGALHDGAILPDPECVRQAAQTVDFLHAIQLLLDPPVLQLADHFLGYVKSKCLSAAVDRGVPGALKTGPMTLDNLAMATNSRSDRLGQIMRVLCNDGIFTFDVGTGLYSHSTASLLLCPDHWTQWHNWVTLYGIQFYDIARGIPESICKDTTRSAAQINFDTDEHMFSYFRNRGWVPQLHRTLGGGAAAQMLGILKDYPWHEVSNCLVMDIGGGNGAFIAGLVESYPTMRGGIYDLPSVIDHVRPFFDDGGQYANVGGRIRDNLLGGDFFASVPACTVYTMKWCLHDWKDTEVVVILKNIRRKLKAEPVGRLVVLEAILSDNHSDRLSQYADINMMMTAGGQERTGQQWQQLAALSGWRIERIWDLRRAWVKAIDFRPVSMHELE